MAEYGVYADVARMKGLLGITDTTDDAELYLQLVAASRDIDRHCHRAFTPSQARATRTTVTQT